MANASRMVVSVTLHRVSDGQTAEELTDLAIARGADHKVPVIRHCRERENRQRHFHRCFVQNTTKRVEVVGRLKECHPSHGPVHDAKHFIRRTYTASSRHLEIVHSAITRKRNLPVCCLRPHTRRSLQRYGNPAIGTREFLNLRRLNAACDIHPGRHLEEKPLLTAIVAFHSDGGYDDTLALNCE